MKIIWKKSLAMILSLVMIMTFPAVDVGASKLSEAEAEMAELQEQLNKAKDLIDSLEDSKEDVQSKVKELDNQFAEISSRLSALETQLEEKDSEIADTQKELKLAEQTASDQYESMKLRIRFMYESSLENNYLEMFLSSGSMADLLNAVEYISQISDYDRNMLTQYQETIEEISGFEAQLEADKAELENLKAIAEDEKNTVAALESAKKAELSKLDNQIDTAEGVVDEYAAEIQAQNEIIAQIKAAMEREANANTPDRVYGGGMFTWPCPSSTRITSDYGPRVSPTSGASSFHRGIDIGADFGADIVAAAAGEVTFAGYSNASGNYVIVNHGSGIRTVYMHASSLCVSTGQQVQAGQVIARVGSTGISTGNHLHFGVAVNGEYVSPWGYL